MQHRIKLTKRTVDRLESDGRERFYWDTELPGFGLRIRASGRKYFIVQFRAKGRERRMTIGQYGTVTADAARRRAIAHIAEARNGVDPAAERDAARSRVTMGALADRFLEEHVANHCKASTARDNRRSIRLYIAPRFAKRDVTDIERRDIERRDIAALHHDMRATPYQANRTLAVLSKMFNLAELWGLRPDGSNPCLHVKRYREEPRERFLSQDEFARLGHVLDAIDEDGSETRSAVTAIRLLMLTGCRLSEIQMLRWEHVDLETGELHLPDTKTGSRIVPLAPAAVRVLAALPRDSENSWVISGKKAGSHLTDLRHPGAEYARAPDSSGSASTICATLVHLYRIAWLHE